MKGNSPRRGVATETRIARTAYGGLAVLVALPFIAVGTYFALAGFGVLTLPGRAHAPLWVIGAVGVAFALAGAVLCGHGLRGLLAARRIRELRRRHADRPWLLDYPWDPSGVTDGGAARWGQALLGVLLVGALLVPMNWWAFFSDDSHFMVRAVVGFFDLAWLLAVAAFAYRFVQYLKYGTSSLSFGAFPFRPGGRVELGFSPNRFARLELVLRFVEEWYEASGQGKHRTIHHRARELFRREWTLSPPAGAREAAIAFDLPDEPELLTRLQADPRVRYWELQVSAAQPGIDFHAAYPLPVYACEAWQVGKPLRRAPVSGARFLRPYAFELGVPVLLCVALAAFWLLAPEPAQRVLQGAVQLIERARTAHAIEAMTGIDKAGMAVHSGPDGRMWALGKYTLARYQGDEPEVLLDAAGYRARFGRRIDALSALQVVGADEVWVGSWYGELLHYRAGEWRMAAARGAPLARRIHALAVHRGTLFVAGGDGLWQMDGDGELRPVTGLPAGAAQALEATADGVLYAALGTEVWQLVGEAWRPLWAGADGAAEVTALRAEAGRLLVATRRGLFLLDADGREVEHLLSGEHLTSVVVADGGYWLGAWRRGLLRVDGARSRQFEPADGLPDPDVNALAADGRGRLWIAIYGAGLQRAEMSVLLSAKE